MVFSISGVLGMCPLGRLVGGAGRLQFREIEQLLRLIFSLELHNQTYEINVMHALIFNKVVIFTFKF